MADKVIVVEPAKPVAEQTVHERMVVCGNDLGLKILRDRGDNTITDEMIERAGVVRTELMRNGPGHVEGRRGW